MCSRTSAVIDLHAAVENERNWRLKMDSKVSDFMDSLLADVLHSRFGRVLPDVVARALQFAKEIDYEHGSVPSKIYLNHPLRVAYLIARYVDSASPALVATALLHNLFEVSSTPYSVVKSLLGSDVADAMRTLTIDRQRQSDASYLDGYYRDIAVDPLAGIVKSADKLDNIYMVCFNPSDEIRSNYLAEIESRVIPLANQSAPVLGKQLSDALLVMKDTGFLNKANELKRLKPETLE